MARSILVPLLQKVSRCLGDQGPLGVPEGAPVTNNSTSLCADYNIMKEKICVLIRHLQNVMIFCNPILIITKDIPMFRGNKMCLHNGVCSVGIFTFNR